MITYQDAARRIFLRFITDLFGLLADILNGQAGIKNTNECVINNRLTVIYICFTGP